MTMRSSGGVENSRVRPQVTYINVVREICVVVNGWIFRLPGSQPTVRCDNREVPH